VTGFVNELRHPVSITVRGPFGFRTLDAYVDTGFNGNLAIPVGIAVGLGMPREGKTPSRIADGSLQWDAVHAGQVDWINGPLVCPTLATELPHALIGTAALDGHTLVVDFVAKSVEIR
jgi:predicted aspartyl protease